MHVVGVNLKNKKFKNCLKCHQNMDHARILKILRSLLWIIHTILVFSVYFKVQMHTDSASDSTDG